MAPSPTGAVNPNLVRTSSQLNNQASLGANNAGTLAGNQGIQTGQATQSGLAQSANSFVQPLNNPLSTAPFQHRIGSNPATSFA